MSTKNKAPYTCTSKDEVESKIFGVERELKEFLDELPRCKGMAVRRESILAIIDRSIDRGKAVLSECDGGSSELSLKAELSSVVIRHLMDKIEESRCEFMLENEASTQASSEDDEPSKGKEAKKGKKVAASSTAKRVSDRQVKTRSATTKSGKKTSGRIRKLKAVGSAWSIGTVRGRRR